MRSTMLLSTAAVMIAGATALAATRSHSDEDAFMPILRAQLEVQQSPNAYEALDALRHEWLGEDQLKRDLPTVFIEMQCTEVTCLRWLESDRVEEIRYVRRHGPGNGWPPTNDNGSIVVTLRTLETVTTADVDRP